jgi:hypothetical protein
VRRGASEVVGAIIVALITMGIAFLYAGHALFEVQTRADSMVDLLRRAAKAQRQLLTLSYSYRDGLGRLHVYIYNMGEDNSTIKIAVLGGAEHAGLVGAVIRPGEMRELVFSNPPPSPTDLIIMTEEGGIFTWRILD